MVFFPPRSFPPLPLIPDDVAICDFMLDEKHGRTTFSNSQNPYTCGLSGKSYSWLEVRDRVDYLSRALAKEFNWHPNRGTEWDKVAACFLVNTIDNLPLYWALLRLGGVVTPANAAYSVTELTYQLKDSKATALFTCTPLLETALTAAQKAGIPQNRVYIVDLPLEFVGNAKAPSRFKTLEQLIEAGKSLPKVERLQWGPGKAARTTAFVCYSSGTSGLPVPPIIITMLRSKELMKKYDLSSVTSIFSGAAPLGAETAKELQGIFPDWAIRQGYGLTETATVVSGTTTTDIWFGSSGNFLPGVEARIVTPDGKEILEYDTPGELAIRSPSVVLGYLNNAKATKETFRDGWMFTGDEAVMRIGPQGTEHMFIVDRIKELIKVKGNQVAPAELEAHILEHEMVADCAVIGIPDEAAGEVPKAFVVKSPSATQDDAVTIAAIKKHVEDHKARHKWLKGGVQFLDVIPKSPSGKILRRLLRDQEREARKSAGSKL
ncbi:hypothetical protein TCE0_015r02893 [Talaromyces pinophilus]|uniref:Uncharacterized protein n=1 Tax=Talaromyces pinophilus TaxID=128442 RepID=A0A6V8H0Y1_TALPI|nr:hypothetical protein TCE0_015r02893 [Talaromyces pinophilus]